MGDGESEPEESVKILDAQGTFDEMMVWGHENLPAADDTFVKGVEEWIRFAETVSFASLACMLQISGVGLIGNTDAWSIDDNEKFRQMSLTLGHQTKIAVLHLYHSPLGRKYQLLKKAT